MCLGRSLPLSSLVARVFLVRPAKKLGAGVHGARSTGTETRLRATAPVRPQNPIRPFLGDFLSRLQDDFAEHYNNWRGRSTIDGAVPAVLHREEAWQRPDRSAKALSGTIERRLSPDTRVIAFRLAA